MAVFPYRGIMPTLGNGVFIAPSADVMGDVVIGEASNIWFQCVIRGDVNHIRIGSHTNVQDGTVIHVTRKTHPTLIGSHVTIGHKAILHGCTIEDYAFIGMGAMVMDGAVVEPYGFVAAGAVVTPGKRVKSGELWAGSPARYMRDIREDERTYIPVSASHYVALAREYMETSRE
jgi:carbonic anhydrase/acetyltransferase-like protein (isoleucine patch superfamily)